MARVLDYVAPAVVAAAGVGWTLSINRPSLLFAFAINWALMGCAFVLWLIVPIRFAPAYYRIHGFERGGLLYRRLGVRVFQRLLRNLGLLNTIHRARGARDEARLDQATRGSETAHALIFVILAVVAVYDLYRGWPRTAAWLTLFNVMFNGYPVLSLRDVRSRLAR